MKIAVLSVAGLALGIAACSQPKPKVAQKHYPLTGKVVSIDLKERTAMVDAAAIPDFMEAMKMDYPIASPTELKTLRVGENIDATVNVGDDGSYTLSNIRESRSPAPPH